MSRPTPFFTVAIAALILLVGCMYASAASAQTVPASDEALVSWENATELTDGTPIPATGDNALATTRIQVGTCGSGTVQVPGALETFGTIISTQNIEAIYTMTTFAGLEAGGTYCFRAKHFTVAGIGSDWSLIVNKVFAKAQPKKPKNPRNPNAQ
jgi:hypothetical protein